ncbi:hypothetical protein GRI97_12140 [Altererythrobacter xixiisoli]|uniref:J domain-containing protein n=1 Tax=Croceibacterium xixiisoli TaxID=1476466 RepID=A0A6I4TYL4_9SPHN|nr:hypothetical protein [Croceibacterium xixiisoli]
MSGSYRREPWRTLEIDETSDRSAIRHAYAARLKTLDIDREIAAYQQLREARDYALMLAREQEHGAGDYAAPLSPFDDPASTDERATEAEGGERDRAPAFDAPAGDAPSTDADGSRDLPATDGGDVAAEEQPPAPPAQMGVAQIAAPEPEEIEATQAAEPEAQEAAEEHPTAPQVLLAILYPGQEYSAEPLDHEMFSLACAALGQVLAEAEESAIDQQQAIEEWLAHHLASSWPRSAHLVEHASENFSWLDESGSLSERPAVRFLNERLRGMRFVEKVQERDHPLRDAWVELSKPGRRRNFWFSKVNKEEVRQLLVGLRERYPEIESYLDPQRVGSWEERLNGGGGSPWGTSTLIIFGILALVRVAGALGGSTQSEPSLPPPIMVQDPLEGATLDQEAIDETITDLFGTRLPDLEISGQTPASFWSGIRLVGRMDGMGQVAQAAQAVPLQQLRQLTQMAARDAPFEQLVSIKQVKLDLLRSIRDHAGVDACVEFSRGQTISQVFPVEESVRSRERALAAKLLEAGLLMPSSSKFPESAVIPGSVVDKVVKRANLTEDELEKTSQGQGGSDIQCRYNIALLEAVLQRPGDVSAELLRMM